MEKKDKRQAILEAAGKLFCELGYEGTSTREIARESGANMAMINYYFGSKNGVFMEVMTERISGFKIQLKSIEDDNISSIEKLHKVIEGYVNRILLNPSFHKMMYRELSLAQRPEMFTKINDAMEQNLLVIENIITEGISNGSFNQIDVRMLIITIKGTISNVVLSHSNMLSLDKNFDLENNKDRKVIKERTIAHLKNLTTVYLTTKNDTQTL